MEGNWHPNYQGATNDGSVGSGGDAPHLVDAPIWSRSLAVPASPCTGENGNAAARINTLLAANMRQSTAYLLKESFGQLWDYEREVWARRFFENWRVSLKWQRLGPYEKFAAMIDRHWDGIAAYCRPEQLCLGS